MAIRRLETIRINGSKGTAFGGSVYSVSYNIGLNESITELELRFVNESGIFQNPELGSKRPYKIQIGNQTPINMYLKTTVLEESPAGNSLVAKFYDGSFVLDTFFVGLHKKMGDKSNSSNLKNRLIIVGFERHPCDVDNDGTFSASDIASLAYDQSDPCEMRCPNSESDLEPIIDTCNKRELVEIFDVTYSFGDLITEISKVLKINKTPKNINNFYQARYTGTLREVLSSWCADFGWAFFWENDKLNFIDASKPLKIQFPSFENTLSATTTRTLEGAVSRGSISYYGQPGILAQQDCTFARPFNLRCLTLFDLFGRFYKPNRFAVAVNQGDEPVSTGGLAPPLPPDEPDNNGPQDSYKDDIYPEGVPISDFETSCVCSFYNQDLRNAYLFYNYYAINNGDLATLLVDKTLDRLGQMRILKVFTATSNASWYNLLVNQPLNDGKPLFETPEASLEFVKKQGYFALVAYDEELLAKQYDIEQNLSKNFMGRHWMRPYTGPFMGETPQITPNGQYFGALSTEIKDIPFASFHHTANSYVGKMTQVFAQVSRNNYRDYNLTPESRQVNTKIVKSIIYMNKNAVWNPLETTDFDFQNLLSSIENKIFRPFEFELDRLPAGFYTFPADLKLKGKVIKLMAFYPDELDVEVQSDRNKFEENLFHAQDINPYKMLTYGLTSKGCYRYTIGGVQILTPAGSSVEYTVGSQFQWLSRSNDAFNPSAPQYKILVSNTTKNRGIIPKVETTFIRPVKFAGNTFSVDYITRSIETQSVKYINQISAPECYIPDDTIKQVHEDFSKNLDYSIDEPLISKTYQIAGGDLSSPVSILKGLTSLSIQISDTSCITNLTIGNTLFVPPTENFITRKLEFEQNPYLKNSRPAPL